MSQFSVAAVRWLEEILYERTGHSFTLYHENQYLFLTLFGSEKKIQFDCLEPLFHESRSDFQCQKWRASIEGYEGAIADELPAPSGSILPYPLIEIKDSGAVVHYDILGLTYWMLSRMEEIGRKDLDNHGRFPATSSHAYQHNYLERPIVDEWIVILRQIIQRVWPDILLSKPLFRTNISHDVDAPSRYGFASGRALIRSMAGDILKHKNVQAALLGPWIRFNSRNSLHISDPFNTFEWLMDVSEANSLTSAFYFICGRTNPVNDVDYEPEHPAIRKLMRRIHERGHEIGLHPSYGTYQVPEAIEAEASRLFKIAREEGIQQAQWGGRMHFLRWDHSITLEAWERAGMTYDSTLGYADSPGFRCGSCFDYPAFNPVTSKALKLRIRPLVVMECSVIAPRYLGLGLEEVAYEKFVDLKNKCRAVGGGYSLLWHNSQFNSEQERVLYQRVLSE